LLSIQIEISIYKFVTLLQYVLTATYSLMTKFIPVLDTQVTLLPATTRDFRHAKCNFKRVIENMFK